MQQNFKRLVAWVHDFKAEDAEQADRMARITADAVNEALKPLGHATAWAPMVADGVSGADELMDILLDCYVRDEVDDNPERNPRMGYVDVGETTIPEQLMAWRDAAVKAALDAQAVPVEWEWGTRTIYGQVIKAGIGQEQLARRWMEQYPDNVALVRRRAPVDGWEDVATKAVS